MGLLDTNLVRFSDSENYVRVSNQKMSNSIVDYNCNVDTGLIGNSIDNPKLFRCLVFNLKTSSTTVDTNIQVWGSLTNGAATQGDYGISLPIYDRYGNEYNPDTGISKAGTYYVDVTGFNTIKFRNQTVVANTVSIYYNFIEDVPSFVTSVKPIQLISEKLITVAANTQDYTVIDSLNGTSQFKFFFIGFRGYSSLDTVKGQTFTLSCSFRNKFLDKNMQSNGADVVGSFESAYAAHTEWFQNYGTGISMFINVQEPTAGDKLYITLYGVR